MLGVDKLTEEMLKIQAEDAARDAAAHKALDETNGNQESYTREQVEALIAEKIAEYAESVEKEFTKEKEKENNGSSEENNGNREE